MFSYFQVWIWIFFFTNLISFSSETDDNLLKPIEDLI